MSTTMPSTPRSGRRNSTSTTYVAPCSRCAGPNTSPRKLCAIIMCPRTVTLYISNPVAERVARRVGQSAHHVGQIVERVFARDDGVEGVVAQTVEGHLHAAIRVEAIAARWRDGTDLRRLDRQAPRMERAAERQRDDLIAVPARLDNPALERNDAHPQFQP